MMIYHIKLNKMKYINADKLKERVKDLKFSTEGIKTVLDLIDELSEEKVVTDNSKVNTHLLNRVEEHEKELIDLKLKLKDLSK